MLLIDFEGWCNKKEGEVFPIPIALKALNADGTTVVKKRVEHKLWTHLEQMQALE